MSRILKALVLTLFCITGYAADVETTPVKADTLEKLQALINEIQSEITLNGRYEFIHPTERADLNATFDSMTTLMGKTGNAATLNEQDRVRLFNLQEHANGILTHTDRNRVVCERSASLGTHIQSNKCQTVAQIEKTRIQAHDFMVDNQKEGDIRYAESIAPVHRGSPGH